MVTTGYHERSVAIGDLKLAYQEWGEPSAPTILALHGFGVSGHMFDEFGHRIEDRYHLIALDQRGHGDSDWAPDADYTRDAFVADIEEARQALGLDHFILMGHSMGGLNAVDYCSRHPERVDALILVDVGPEAAKEGVENIMRFTQGPDELEFDEFVHRAMQFNKRRTEANIRERMRHRLRPLEGGKWTWKFDKRFREGNGAVKSGSDLSSDELWQQYRSLPMPTLLIRGLESDILSQEVAQRLATEMRRARLVVVPDAGHSVPGDNPDDFTGAVTGFLRDLQEDRFMVDPPQSPPPLDDLVETHREWRPSGARLLGLAIVAAAALAVVGAVVLSRTASRPKKRRRLTRPRTISVAQAGRALHAGRALPAAGRSRLRKSKRSRALAQRLESEARRASSSRAVDEARRRAIPAAEHARGVAGQAARSATKRLVRHLIVRGLKVGFARGVASIGPARGRRKQRRRRPRWRS